MELIPIPGAEIYYGPHLLQTVLGSDSKLASRGSLLVRAEKYPSATKAVYPFILGPISNLC